EFIDNKALNRFCKIIDDGFRFYRLFLEGCIVGETFLIQFIDALQKSNMKYLDLEINMTKDCFRMIIKILSTIRTIIYINLNYCDIYQIDGSMIINSLKENQLLRVLDISKNKIDISMECISHTLALNKTLSVFNIGHNKISLHGAKVTASMLEITRTLLYLNISGNSLTDDGLVSIAKALKLNKSLIRLDIDECGFFDKGLSELSKVLTENSILTHLSMFRNEHITDDGINTLLNALEINKTLLVIFISNTTISNIM
ncbi:unnamed protein product, partial [Didymodactylos carnosus]